MQSNPWQIVFPNCEYCCFVVIINQHTPGSKKPLKSHSEPLKSHCEPLLGTNEPLARAQTLPWCSPLTPQRVHLIRAGSPAKWVAACRRQVVVKRNDRKHITLASSVLRQHLMTIRALVSVTFHTVTGTAPLLGSVVLRALRDESLEAHLRDCRCAAKVGTPPDG